MGRLPVQRLQLYLHAHPYPRRPRRPHILCDPDAGAVTGIIDWTDATVGDPAADFSGLLSILSPPSVANLLSQYRGPLDPAFSTRMAQYQLLWPYHDVLHGLETGDSSALADGLRFLSRA